MRYARKGEDQFLPRSTPSDHPFPPAWLQTRVNLEELKIDDDYCEQRLGFRGPNVLVMTLQED